MSANLASTYLDPACSRLCFDQEWGAQKLLTQHRYPRCKRLAFCYASICRKLQTSLACSAALVSTTANDRWLNGDRATGGGRLSGARVRVLQFLGGSSSVGLGDPLVKRISCLIKSNSFYWQFGGQRNISQPAGPGKEYRTAAGH
ncbi:uncharacterized protein LOC142563566 [Dermacentor variabilis]|uniref:uncharacterized protein LOC142563566 n=1 Tax=Dermacentor variabilis TaxID=34621 RepID=UPI003F5B7431